jgi:hypothetical protein
MESCCTHLPGRGWRLLARLVMLLAGFTWHQTSSARERGDASAGATRSVPLPPLIPGGVPMAQIFHGHVSQTDQLRATRVIIWGARAPIEGIYTSYYHPVDRDPNRQRSPAWYIRNMPGWMTLKCDRSSPASGFTYSWGQYAGLDFARDDVRRFIFETYLLPAIEQGYPAIALDNVETTNWKEVCGVFRDGQWLQQYTGARRDPVYLKALHEYISWLRNEVNSHGAALILNIGVDFARIGETRS